MRYFNHSGSAPFQKISRRDNRPVTLKTLDYVCPVGATLFAACCI